MGVSICLPTQGIKATVLPDIRKVKRKDWKKRKERKRMELFTKAELGCRSLSPLSILDPQNRFGNVARLDKITVPL